MKKQLNRLNIKTLDLLAQNLCEPNTIDFINYNLCFDCQKDLGKGIYTTKLNKKTLINFIANKIGD